MKGIILRELYVLKGVAKLYIAMIIIFSLLAAVTDNAYFSLFPALFAGLLPYTVLYYDEKGKWDIYSQILPVTRAKSVIANYLVGFFAVLCVAVITVIGLVSAEDKVTYAIGLTLSYAVGLGLPSVTLPIYYRLGTIKGKFAGIIISGIIAGFSAIAFNSFALSDSYMNGVLKRLDINPFAAVIVIIISTAVYALSCLLSIKLYQKREL